MVSLRRERLDSETVFAGMEPRRAVRYMAFPAIVSQLIVLLFILNSLIGMYGLVWAQLAADVIAAVISWIMFAVTIPSVNKGKYA